MLSKIKKIIRFCLHPPSCLHCHIPIVGDQIFCNECSELISPIVQGVFCSSCFDICYDKCPCKNGRKIIVSLEYFGAGKSLLDKYMKGRMHLSEPLAAWITYQLIDHDVVTDYISFVNDPKALNKSLAISVAEKIKVKLLKRTFQTLHNKKVLIVHTLLANYKVVEEKAKHLASLGANIKIISVSTALTLPFK